MKQLTVIKAGKPGRRVRGVRGHVGDTRLPKIVKDLVMLQNSIRAFRSLSTMTRKLFPSTRLPVYGGLDNP